MKYSCQIHSPWLGDIVDSGKGGLTLSPPQSGTMNLIWLQYVMHVIYKLRVEYVKSKQHIRKKLNKKHVKDIFKSSFM